MEYSIFKLLSVKRKEIFDMFSVTRRFSKWRDLIFILALTNLKQRYKQRYLRLAWAVLNPLFTMLIFTIVFSRVAKLPSEGAPYPLFNFTALVPWTFFAASMGFCVYSLNANCGLITRINFPRITIPLASILATFFDFIISSILLIILFCIYQAKIGINSIFIIPILFIQILFMVGVGFVLSVANAYLRDIQNAIPLLMQAWMLASPVGYSLNMVGEKFRFFYLLNPMAGILDSYRKVLLHNQAPNFYYLSMSFLIAIVTFLFGYWFFKRNEKNLADIISI